MSTVMIEQPTKENSNKILLKGLITGILILIMLIPTWFVSNLVKEREERQKQIVQEVSSKWASAQRVSGPYISVPYIDTQMGADGKPLIIKRNLVLLPENLNVNGTIIPQPKYRSIYKVMVYKTDIHASGTFNISLPDDLRKENMDFSKARICVGVTDYKGIEEMISVRFNDKVYNLSPGLPTNQVDDAGLSAPIMLSAGDLSRPVAFNSVIKLKGSKGLYFLPLSANSKYQLQSTWNDPSFDGATLPGTSSKAKDSGFTASWSFNQANLPYGTTLTDGSLKNANTSFGVNLIQPADQYAKTMRSVKYAILFIGLTFALFFIIELMQQRPVHPVQYILVGIALVIFYTLLLSISEFIAFDLAYTIAATATVLLITLYAKGHFQSWKTAAVFAAVLSSLYGFIFILIRLEDTALLVGSIGLFIVLALVMYASRKVNWYSTQPRPTL
jgi:inner membrane protein